MLALCILLFVFGSCAGDGSNQSADATSDAMNDQEAVQTDADELEVGLGDNTNIDEITTDIVLPTSGDNGCNITWESSDESVISLDGKVTRPAYGEGDKTVILTATITKGSSIEVVIFTIVVKEQPPPVDNLLEDKANLEIIYSGTDSASNVTTNITLPTSGSNGSVITWETSNSEIISTSGSVSRPAVGSGNKSVTLTATLTLNAETDTKSFTLTVIEEVSSSTDAELLEQDKNNLVIIYSGGDSDSSVTNDITLPNVGSNGSEIIWSSSNDSVIATDGSVNRPAYGDGNATVTLIATLSLNAETDTKSFTLTVIENEPANPPTISYSEESYEFTQNTEISAITPTVSGTPFSSLTVNPTLPDGLSIDSSSGEISGTPTVTQVTTEHTINVSNANGSNFDTISITVYEPGNAPTINFSLSSHSFTEDYAITPLTPILGGDAPTSCTSSPALPSGLWIDPTSCQIIGVPSTPQSATTYTITASNASGNGQDSLQITVTAASSDFSTVSTLAGSTIVGPGYADGMGSDAKFSGSYEITSDGTNLYVSETFNKTIRKIVIATGEVNTLAGSPGLSGSVDGIGSDARFETLVGLAVVGNHLYVSELETCTIRKVSITTGEVTPFAGSNCLSGSVDGTGNAAGFFNPFSMTTDGTDLYLIDGYSVRSIAVASAAVTTLAGSADTSGVADGAGNEARFQAITGITTDGTDLFVTEMGNHSIRSISIASGEVSTFAGGHPEGPGTTDGVGTGAKFMNPSKITTDGTYLYVKSLLPFPFINLRKIEISTATVSTISNSSDMNGNMGGIVDEGSFIYSASDQHIIQVIDKTDGSISIFAGSIPASGNDDGTGTDARFRNPRGIANDSTNLYVADTLAYTIRKIIMATRVVTTFAGYPQAPGSTDGTGTGARFSNPAGITRDGDNLYVTDAGHTIRKIVISSRLVTTFVGTAGSSGTSDGTGNAARFDRPTGITNDGTNLYVIDSRNHTVREINLATEVVTTIAGTAGVSGSADGIGTAASFNFSLYSGITTDGSNLYITDSNNHKIRKVDIATGEVTTLAGSFFGYVNGIGTDAMFSSPSGIAHDAGDLYVADTGNYAIRKIVIATGEVTSVSNNLPGTEDGAIATARFYKPSGITVIDGVLYVLDKSNSNIRIIE